MTFRTYPQFSNPDRVMDGLRLIAQIRPEDIKTINTLEAQSTYKQASYRNVREVSSSVSIGPFDYHIEADATGGAITITLPADQTIGCRELVVSKKDSSGNAVTISGNGKNINGSATASAATQYSFKRMHYLPTAGEWRIL